MSQLKPMSYVSLRTILQHAEPNLRIKLSQKIPSIQCTEKTVPLRLESLDIMPEQIVIDGIPYSIEIMEFQPKSIVKLNSITRRGKSFKPPFEVDKYGLRIYGVAENLTPGDVKLEDVKAVDEEEHLQELKDEFMFTKRFISVCDDQSMKNRNEERAEFRKNLIEKYRRRSEGQVPKFRYFMVFKISESREILEYKGNLSIALKYMSQKLLGARGTIEVKHLYLESGPVPILRLPESLKFKVKNLDVFECEKPLATLRSILCPTSFPLKALIVDFPKKDDSEFLKSAQLLVPRSGFPESHRVYSRVHYPMKSCFIKSVLNTVQSWKEEKPEQMTHVSFSSDLNRIEFAFKLLTEKTGAVSKEGSVILPLDDGLEILSYISQFVLPVKHMRTEPYQLNLKVQKRSSS